MRSLITAFLVILGLGALAGGTIAALFLLRAPGLRNEQVVFLVPPSTSFAEISRRLEKEGLISSAIPFRWLGRLTGDAKRIRVGEYALHRGMRPPDILQVLVSGKSITYPFLVQEGLNMFEIGRSLEEKGLGKYQAFLAAAQNAALIRELLGEDLPSLEGYLFPETYQITRFTSEVQLVRQMVQYSLAAIQQVAPADRQKGKARHELVILASLIEKETGAPEERPIISSVFHNRLARGMRLQSDPTILYGMWLATGQMPTNIRKSDILAPTPYNTYTVPALPVGPIANPGRESLAAALRPAKTDYLYFVSRNNGTHVFSRTYKEHENAVRSFQLNPAMREGRSWRDRTRKQGR